MNSVLKIMKQPLRAVPQKQPFTKQIMKLAKYLRNIPERTHFLQNGRQTGFTITGNEPPERHSSSIPKIERLF